MCTQKLREEEHELEVSLVYTITVSQKIMKIRSAFFFHKCEGLNPRLLHRIGSAF